MKYTISTFIASTWLSAQCFNHPPTHRKSFFLYTWINCELISFPIFHLLFLSLFQNVLEQKAKERKWRRTLASLQRLRTNKDDEENDARGDLSSAIVTSVALEEPTSVGASKSVPRVCSQFLASIVLGLVCNNNDRNRDRCLGVFSGIREHFTT